MEYIDGIDLQHAVVAAEDRSFYENDSGIDIKGIARAGWRNITGKSNEGASTIRRATLTSPTGTRWSRSSER